MSEQVETLITASVPEWITSVMGLIALSTGLGILALIWTKLKPLVREEVHNYTDPKFSVIDYRLQGLYDTADLNKQAIDLLRHSENKQNTEIEVNKNEIKNLNEKLDDLKLGIKQIYEFLTKKE